MRQPGSDVVIVGGGLMGAATAFFLRRRGRSVTLLEQGMVGQFASGTNFGNVRRQGRYLPQLPLANRSRAIWGRLPELLGEDVEFLPTGHIRICYRQEQIGVLEAYARDARAYGLELELITQNALRHRFPFIGPEAILGSYSPEDGHANPRLAAPAFARAAVRAGARIHERTQVVSVEKAGEDFAVRCEDGREFRAPIVQISAGAWGNLLSERLGEPVPLVARGPQMAVTEPAPYAIRPVLGVSTPLTEETVYLRQIPRGNVIFGGGNRGPAFTDIRRAYVLPDNTLAQLRQIRRVVPQLASLRVIRVWSGVESYLPDDRPIMGPSGRVPGLYYAFGFCGHGFQLGPGVGDVMAELIDTGTTSTPLEPFHIARFAQNPGTSGTTGVN
ncbi:MAG: FAD-binding oxidoreductase [Dongiaceae bacterium]